jgi:BMFP domain-containing protein YqiC
MDSTKNFFEAWMNTQSQIAGKIKETFDNNEIVNKSLELYKNWFDNQKSLADSILTSMQSKGSEQMPELVKQWMEAQMQAGTRLMEFFTPNAQQNPSANFAQNPQDWFGNITRGLQSMFSQQPNTPFNFGQSTDQIKNLLNNTQTYLQMMEMWQKGYKMMQDMGVNAPKSVDDLMKMFDMNQYKNVLDGMFKFMTPDKSNNFLQQIQQYSQSIMEQFPQLQKMMGDFGKFAKPEAMLHNSLQSVASVYQNFNEQFHKHIDPYFTTAPSGKEKEISVLMLQVQDKLVKYYIHSTELQQLAYETGRKGIEHTLQQALQKTNNDLSKMSFEEFYNLWVETMENDTIMFFNSNSYSELQGNLLKLGLEIKADLEKQMEKMLANLPIVPRSEMDALNQTVHELKRKIRALEQAQEKTHTTKVEEEDESKTKPATARKATTKKQ